MKIFQYIERILWATRMASLTSPTYVGGHMPHDEESPSTVGSHAEESPSPLRDHEDSHFASA